ncbi:MAG: histidinol-phosphate transaminase [Bacillota bacterium]|nr:histidinol-phosphate transaminase [Bacillota bacterium]
MNKPDMRSYLEQIKPYVPGKPVEEVEREFGLTNVIKLASNENSLGPSPIAVKAMQEKIDKMHIYPDGNSFYLRQALAEKLKLNPGQFIFGNGSDEILSFIALAYFSPGDEAVTVSPSFSEYDFAARLVGAVPRPVPLRGENFLYDVEAMLSQVNDKTKAVFICSPNNPTGSVIGRAELDYLVKKLPEKVLIVLDQAYIEYVEDPDHNDGFGYLNEGFPVVILRTFSKIYGLAGLRIGYGIAPVEIVADINRVREPFNVNAMAQAAALAAVGDDQHVIRSREMVASARKQIDKGLAELGLKAVPDQANFFFVNTGVDSKLLFQEMLKRGVIIRTGDIFGFPEYIRVTYGTESENKRFLEVLKVSLVELS